MRQHGHPDGPPNPASLHLLGRPSLQARGSCIEFRPQRRFQLLALLGLRAGQRVERDRIAQIFWPRHPLADARRNLRKVIFRAREVSGVEGLQVDGQTLCWSVRTDLQAFGQAVREGRHAEAVALWDGPVLSGLTDPEDPADAAWSEWLAIEATRLTAAWQEAAHHLLRQLTDAAQRQMLAERLLAVDALDEAAVTSLIEVEMSHGGLAAAKRSARALAGYEANEATRPRPFEIPTHCNMRSRILVPVLLVLLAAAALYVERAPLALRMLARGAERTLSSNPFAAVPDGIQLALCGAGGSLLDPHRSGPCVAAQAGRLHLVIDAGGGAARNLLRMRFPIGGIDAVLLTHFHSDHIDGLGELAMQRWVNAANTAPLPVLGPEGTAAVVAGFDAAYAADARYRNAYHGDGVAPASGAGMAAREFRLPDAGESTLVLERDAARVTLFAVDHSPVSPAVGYRIDYRGRSVVVSGDSAKSANLEAMAKGADLLVHEALSRELVGVMHDAAAKAGRPILEKITSDIPGYHTSPVEAARIASAAAGATRLIHYHIVPPLALPGMEAVFLQGVSAAYAGPVTVGVDVTLFSLPAGSGAVEELPNAS